MQFETKVIRRARLTVPSFPINLTSSFKNIETGISSLRDHNSHIQDHMFFEIRFITANLKTLRQNRRHLLWNRRNIIWNHNSLEITQTSTQSKKCCSYFAFKTANCDT